MRITETKLRRAIRKLIVEYDDGFGNYYDGEDAAYADYDALYHSLDGWANNNMDKNYLISGLQSGFQNADYETIISVVEDWIAENAE